MASSSWPFQVNLLAAKEQPIAQHDSRGGRHRLGRHHDDARQGAASELRLHVDGHSLTPKVQGDLAAWFGSVPVVPAACKGNALLGPDGCKTNGQENFDKIHFWRTPVAKCEQGELRALQPLGHGLHRRPRRSLSPLDARGGGQARASPAMQPRRPLRTREPPLRRRSGRSTR